MPNVESILLNAVLSAVFKGVSGSGKTIASCGKEFRPVYTFDFEGRMDAVANYYYKLDGHCRDLVYDTYPLGTSFTRVNQKMDELARSCPFKTVNIASLTSFIHFILKHTIEAKFGQVRKSGQQAGKTIGGIPVNELEDYNAEDSGIIYELISFLQTIKARGTNIILEAHITPYEVKRKGEDTTETIFQILTKGKKAPALIPGYFNEVYYFKRELEGLVVGQQNIKYVMDVKGDPSNECKTSMGMEGFDWTGKDFSEMWTARLPKNRQEAQRADPNAPKTVSF